MILCLRVGRVIGLEFGFSSSVAKGFWGLLSGFHANDGLLLCCKRC